MLMERFEGESKPLVCEQPGEKPWKAPTHPAPRRLLLKWRGGDAPTVFDWPGWDAAAAYLHAEHMAGLREGDVIVLYSLNWQSQWGGHC